MDNNDIAKRWPNWIITIKIDRKTYKTIPQKTSPDQFRNMLVGAASTSLPLKDGTILVISKAVADKAIFIFREV
jgi:hypothetical protein